MITALVTDGEVVSDGDGTVPWWSFGKTVLAASALALVAQGRLSLDANVPGASASLRDVLRHRAGLGDYGALPAYHRAVASGETPWPHDEMAARVDASQPRRPPGQVFAYSNLGYALVARLVAERAGADLGEALRVLVLEPLGVRDVSLARHPSDLARTAWGNPSGYHPGWVYHGLLVGPAASAALLLHRLLVGRLLPPPLAHCLRAALPAPGEWPGRPWRAAGYALGLMVGDGDPPGSYVGHTGGGPGSTAAVYRRLKGGRTGAAFAPIEAPGTVERRAMALAGDGDRG